MKVQSVLFFFFLDFEMGVVPVEVCLKPLSTARVEDVRLAVEKYVLFNPHSSLFVILFKNFVMILAN